MSTRQTSIDAYHEIMDSGICGRRQKEVYDILFHHGPLTYNQVFEKLKLKHGGSWTGINSTRLTELRDMGVIQEVGTTKDQFSRMTVILWDVTDGSPVKPAQKETKDQVIARQAAKIAELEAEILKLRSELPRQQSLFQGH